MADTKILVEAWVAAKRAEADAVEWRRRVEDDLLKTIGLSDDFEGTENLDIAGHKVKVVGRMNRKVDAERLQEIAAEHGLSHHLSALFRWKPEINSSIWKSTDPSITTPLLGAVTTSPGRPSFSITKEQ
jgi:hypothetical protein